MKIAWAASLFAIATLIVPALAKEPVAVNVGISNNVSDVPFFVADKRGYFAAENLKVNLLPFDAAAKMVAPMASGDLDVGGGGISAGLFNAVARGVGMKIVADKSTSAPGLGTGALMVRKDLVDSGAYKSARDLRGRKLAVPAAGTGTSTTLERFFNKDGLGLRDVDLVYMSFPQMAIALQNKAIDAAFLTEPMVTTSVSRGDAIRIVTDDEMFPYHQIAVTLFSEKFIRGGDDVARRFMRAMLRGARDYTSTVSNGRLAGPGADDMISILTQYGSIKDPSIYRKILVHACDPDGRLNLESLRADLDYFRAQGFIEGKVELKDAINPSIAEAAARDLGPYKHD